MGLTGSFYLAGSIVLGALLLVSGLAFGITRSMPAARRLLKASVFYLPLLLGLCVVDAGF